MPRHGSSRLTWLEPSSSGGLSPMQLLVIWLSRQYTAFTSSNSKAEMLEELCQGMRDSGFPGCTVYAIRSKIDSLRREVRREFSGDHRHSLVFQQFQQPLMVIFASEQAATRETNDTSDTEASDSDDGAAADSQVNEESEVKTEPEILHGSRSAPFVVSEGENIGRVVAEERHQRMLQSRSSLDVTEIRRRFELLCARHELQQQGIAMELIERILPLPEE